jgi:hypothetical protein
MSLLAFSTVRPEFTKQGGQAGLWWNCFSY